MTLLESKMIILRQAVLPITFGTALGKLKLRFSSEQDVLHFAILDCFDQSIRKSGQVLIEADGSLRLFSAQGCKIQSAQRSGKFITDLVEGPVKTALGQMSALRAILVLGTGSLTFTRVSLVDNREKTRARAEFVFLEPTGKGAPITLVVVKAMRGYQKAFDLLSGKLAESGGAQTTELSSFYSGLFPSLASYDAKPGIAMTSDESAFQAANDIVSAHLSVARQNEDGVVGDHDTEFLHDYRVALRKIRSVISLFKGVYSVEQTATLTAAFSDLMTQTGRMRDLDVYLLDRQTYFDLLPSSLHAGLTVMFDMFETERNAELAALSKRFRGKSYAKTIGCLQTLFSKPKHLEQGPNADLHAHEYACAVIWKRYRKVCTIAAAIDNETDDEEVHELRIQCKKLRYLIEFFEPLFPSRDVKTLIKPLKTLLDNLGLFNDYSVQQVSLQAFLDQHASKGRRKDMAIASSIGALIVILHQRQLKERVRVVSSFAQFNSPDVQSRFRLLFHGNGDEK